MERPSRCFARQGARVLAVDMNVAAVEETRAIIQKEGNECTIQRADVTKSEQVKAAVETCIQTVWSG